MIEVTPRNETVEYLIENIVYALSTRRTEDRLGVLQRKLFDTRLFIALSMDICFAVSIDSNNTSIIYSSYFFQHYVTGQLHKRELSIIPTYQIPKTFLRYSPFNGLESYNDYDSKSIEFMLRKMLVEEQRPFAIFPRASEFFNKDINSPLFEELLISVEEFEAVSGGKYEVS